MEHGHLDAMHALDEIDFEQGIMKDSEEHDQDTSHMMAESILDYEKRLDFLVSSVLAQYVHYPARKYPLSVHLSKAPRQDFSG